MKLVNEKGNILSILLILILLVGIPVGVYLAKTGKIFKSRATFIPTAQFVDTNGNILTETRDPNVRLKITRDSVSIARDTNSCQYNVSVYCSGLGGGSTSFTSADPNACSGYPTGTSCCNYFSCSDTQLGTITKCSSSSTCPAATPTPILPASSYSYNVAVGCSGTGGNSSCSFGSNDAGLCTSYPKGTSCASLPCKSSTGGGLDGIVYSCYASPIPPDLGGWHKHDTPTGPDADGDGDPDTTDCMPNDARIYHGNVNYSYIPYTDKNGNKSFDYDCDGVEIKQFGLSTFTATGCFSEPQSGLKGYIGTVPACGQTATYRSCGAFTTSSCGGKSCSVRDPECPQSLQCEDSWNTPLANNGVAGTDTAQGWSISDKVPGAGGVPGLPQPCK